MRNAAGARRLIVALDFTSLAPAMAMARQLQGLVRTVKIGSALFTACGPAVIQRVRALGFAVMLDLKFFDIPSTVELSCRAAVHHRVAFLTMHAAGEPAMLEAAVRGVRSESARLRVARPLVLGVTVLTSVERRAGTAVTKRVADLARRALEAGCDGVVASAQEASMLRRRFGTRLRIVCPGIRPASARSPARLSRAPGRAGSWRAKSSHDQHRVCSPAEALALGADWLVVGRPITGASRPRVAAAAILSEMKERA